MCRLPLIAKLLSSRTRPKSAGNCVSRLAWGPGESTPRHHPEGCELEENTNRLLFGKIAGGTEHHDDGVILQFDGAGMERHCQLGNWGQSQVWRRQNLSFQNELDGGAVAGDEEENNRGAVRMRSQFWIRRGGSNQSSFNGTIRAR